MLFRQIFFTLFILVWPGFSVSAQDSGLATNVVLITLDGLRGEEVFAGADQRLMIKENGVEKPNELKDRYWGDDRAKRRELLLPFLWGLVREGKAWIAGDLESESLVAVTNGHFFSYPGYNEILSGFPDPAVNSNDKKYNLNTTVLEWLNGKPSFEGKVAAYGSWDVFPYIINDQRSKIPVNAGWQPFRVGNPDRVDALNFISKQLFHEWEGVRYDVLTTSGAIEDLKTNQPRVLFVSLGETDDWAHVGKYEKYLLTAQQNDYFIQRLWETVQSLPSHKDKTAFVITSDHGRGDGREGWKNHSDKLPGSERIWVAAFGAGVARSGVDRGGRFEQAQTAATVAALLGEDFTKFKSAVRPPLPITK
jgi:Type I phosphodiesterase / nucleotide pyrophosphatase